MPFESRVTLCPTVGAFTPGSFAEHLQSSIHLPGLDPTWIHTLIAVQVAPDGSSADLTVHHEPVVALSLDRPLRIVAGTPAARVRTVDLDGAVLAEGAYSAPLRVGQNVEIAGDHYRVHETTWPGRHPDTGVCVGDVDWQLATVQPAPRPPVAPTATTEGG